MVSTLPEKLFEEILLMPVLCIQFNASTVFSIMESDISEESFILNLNKKYQALLKKAADYYLNKVNI
ncbi:hypothetical protein RhiirB3_445251 [Rhizophagus irregularis]|nr:hypothetical protein RhiirB3_445251 [Rhizophagus irregularis]